VLREAHAMRGEGACVGVQGRYRNRTRASHSLTRAGVASSSRRDTFLRPPTYFRTIKKKKKTERKRKNHLCRSHKESPSREAPAFQIHRDGHRLVGALVGARFDRWILASSSSI